MVDTLCWHQELFCVEMAVFRVKLQCVWSNGKFEEFKYADECVAMEM